MADITTTATPQGTKRKAKACRWPLPLHEWDFHEVEAWDVGFAIGHEYARECPEQMEALARLMTPEWYVGWKRMNNEVLAAKAKGDGATVVHITKGKAWSGAQRVWRQVDNSHNRRLVDTMHAALDLGLDWQAPWVLHRKRVAKAVKALNSGFDGVDLVFLESFPPRYTGKISDLAQLEHDKGKWHWWHEREVSRYVLHIDWHMLALFRDPKRKLVKSVAKALEGMGPPGKRGRQAAVPFDILRALAAWRLHHKAGCSFDDAREAIRRRARECGLPYARQKKIGGFPDLSDARAWKEAICRAENFLQHLRS